MVGLIVAILIVIGVVAITVLLILGPRALGPDEHTDDEKHFPGW